MVSKLPLPVQFHGRSSRKVTLAQYILRRLAQYGCHHLHGVPGDFCLPFLSQVTSKTSPVKWIGSTNELNGAYAADGYSRVTGLGALCTTYGVGELSAINAIAGSFAERVSVMHIVGTPRLALQKTLTTSSKQFVHHMLGYGRDPGDYHGIAKRVTSMQVKLNDPLTAPKLFDTALDACLSNKRPVYIELPSDMAEEMVDEEPLETYLPTQSESADYVDRQRVGTAILEKLKKAQRPLIMVDGVSYRFGLEPVINTFVSSTGIPTVCLPHGLGVVGRDAPNFLGVYAGSASEPQLRDYVASADLVFLFGPLLADTNTAGWTAVPPPEVTISFHGDEVELDGVRTPLHCRALLEGLASSSEIREFKERVFYLPEVKVYMTPRDLDLEAPITQDLFYMLLSSHYLEDFDTILLANGTPLIGARLLDIPKGSRVIASGLWFSVGHMLPAAQGAALAKTSAPEESGGRTILLEGDGSFQATATELSTIIRYKLDMTIFVVNNEGYAYERLYMGREEVYNDVLVWDYLKFPEAFGAASTNEYPIMVKKVTRVGELEELLLDPKWNDGKGLKLVDVVMGKEDVPEYYRGAFEGAEQRLRWG